MKHLNNFRTFDGDFFKKIREVLTDIRYNIDKKCLTAELAIIADENDYGDKVGNNIFEKFRLHIEGTTEADLKKYLPLVGKQVNINVSKATVWGNYDNQLSCIGTIQVVNEGKQ